LDPEILNPLSASTTGKSKVMTTSMCIRLTKRDAEVLREEAVKRGFSTMGGYARSVLRNSIGRHDESSVLLETILRVEFLLFEYFKAVSPEGEEAGLRGIREKADAVSMDLLQNFIQRRVRSVEWGEESSGR